MKYNFPLLLRVPVKSKKVNTPTGKISHLDISSLPAGAYRVVVKRGDSQVSAQFIKIN